MSGKAVASRSCDAQTRSLSGKWKTQDSSGGIQVAKGWNAQANHYTNAIWYIILKGSGGWWRGVHSSNWEEG